MGGLEMDKVYRTLCGCIGKDKALKMIVCLSIMQCTEEEKEYLAFEKKVNNALTLFNFYIQKENLEDIIKIRTDLFALYALIVEKTEVRYPEYIIDVNKPTEMAITSLQ